MYQRRARSCRSSLRAAQPGGAGRIGSGCAVAAGAEAVHLHPRRGDGDESLLAVDVGAAVTAVRQACPGTPVGVHRFVDHRGGPGGAPLGGGRVGTPSPPRPSGLRLGQPVRTGLGRSSRGAGLRRGSGRGWSVVGGRRREPGGHRHGRTVAEDPGGDQRRPGGRRGGGGRRDSPPPRRARRDAAPSSARGGADVLAATGSRGHARAALPDRPRGHHGGPGRRPGKRQRRADAAGSGSLGRERFPHPSASGRGGGLAARAVRRIRLAGVRGMARRARP